MQQVKYRHGSQVTDAGLVDRGSEDVSKDVGGWKDVDGVMDEVQEG